MFALRRKRFSLFLCQVDRKFALNFSSRTNYKRVIVENFERMKVWRPVRFIHHEGLSFLCVRMSGCACHLFRLIQDIPCCLLIPVHGMSAYRAEIRPVGQF